MSGPTPVEYSLMTSLLTGYAIGCAWHMAAEWAWSRLNASAARTWGVPQFYELELCRIGAKHGALAKAITFYAAWPAVAVIHASAVRAYRKPRDKDTP